MDLVPASSDDNGHRSTVNSTQSHRQPRCTHDRFVNQLQGPSPGKEFSFHLVKLEKENRMNV